MCAQLESFPRIFHVQQRGLRAGWEQLTWSPQSDCWQTLQDVSTGDTKLWWVTSGSHSVLPQQAAGCQTAGVQPHAAQRTVRCELKVPLSWWIGSRPSTLPSPGKVLTCSGTSGHWQEAGTQVLPVWSGCLPGSWCLSRICWFAATASL